MLVFMGVHTETTYPLSMAISVSAFLAQSTAFLQPDMIVCGCTLDATNCSASYNMTINDNLCRYFISTNRVTWTD